MVKNQQYIVILIVTALFTTLACNSTFLGSGNSNKVVEEIPVEIPATVEVGQVEQPVEVAADEDAQAYVAMLPVDPVAHAVMPGVPVVFEVQKIFDCNTGQFVQPDGSFQIGLGCDIWNRNYIERPHTLGDYVAEYDIIETKLGLDDTWYYVRIDMYNPENQQVSLTKEFAIEIDLTLDARGDVLIYASDPAQNGNTWDVAGIQVWFDENDDVGGAVAVEPDNDPGDGYEKLIFNQGLGDDPDLAWVRISPEAPWVVEFAFKNTLLREITEFSTASTGGVLSRTQLQVYDLFEWWVWAGEGLDPAKFDFVDTEAQDARDSVDNTCGWIFGGRVPCRTCAPIPFPRLPPAPPAKLSRRQLNRLAVHHAHSPGNINLKIAHVLIFQSSDKCTVKNSPSLKTGCFYTTYLT
jgi:hypothetical protein